MGQVRVTNTGPEPVALMFGDPLGETPSVIVRLKCGESYNALVEGSPDPEREGLSRCLLVVGDGPWVDEEIRLMTEAIDGDDHDGSVI